VRRSLAIVFIFLPCLLLHSQAITVLKDQPSRNNSVDSLLLHIEKMSADTQKVKQLFQLCLSLKWNNLPQKLNQLANEAMLISEREKFTKGKGLTLYIKGFTYYGQRNYRKALDTITHALNILESIQDITNSGHCHFLMAHINYDMGNYPLVIVHSEASLAKWTLSGYNALNGVCNNDMALAYIRMGKYNKAVEYSLKAYQACKAISDKQGMAQSLQLMGSSFYDFKNYENAFKNIKAASLLNLELKDSFAFARNNNMLGEIYLEQNNLPEAMKLFRQSFDTYSRPGAPLWGVPWGYSNIGSVYEKTADSLLNHGRKENATENYHKALKNYQQSLQEFQAIKDPAGSAEQMMLLGRTHFKINNILLAKKYLTRGLALALQIGEKRHLIPIYLYLSKVDSAETNIKLAYTHYKLYLLYRDSVYNQQSLQSLLAYKAQEDAEKKDNEIALLETENKLQKALSEKKSQSRNFAYVLTGLLFISGSYAFYRYRIRKRTEVEQAKLKDRLHISQGLHDDIGSTLSSISVYTQVAQKLSEKNSKEELSEMLGKIQMTSSEMISEMNDIVWTIHPKNDSMEKIIHRMESYARPMLMTRNIDFKLEYDPSIITTHLDMEKRKNFYLVFKEAVNNAFKYSGCSEIITRISNSKSRMEMQIIDNGVGFDVQQEIKGDKLTLSGNGLRNMKMRAEEMKGDLQIDSVSGEGTEVKLSIPIP
jgi:signal transduction histidine kinase